MKKCKLSHCAVFACERTWSFCVVVDGTVSRAAREIREDWRVSVGSDRQVYEGVVIIRTGPGAGANDVRGWEDEPGDSAQPTAHCRTHRLGQTAVQTSRSSDEGVSEVSGHTQGQTTNEMCSQVFTSDFVQSVCVCVYGVFVHSELERSATKPLLWGLHNCVKIYLKFD